eukprot:COSAG03_NODE_2434_length_2773_cov_2.731488_3_plen_115_part_00
MLLTLVLTNGATSHLLQSSCSLSARRARARSRRIALVQALCKHSPSVAANDAVSVEQAKLPAVRDRQTGAAKLASPNRTYHARSKPLPYAPVVRPANVRRPYLRLSHNAAADAV